MKMEKLKWDLEKEVEEQRKYLIVDNIFIALIIFLVSMIFFTECQTPFKKSAIETKEKDLYSLYALCVRSQQDENTSGKNQMICDEFKEEIIKQENLKLCSTVTNNECDCFVQIYRGLQVPCKEKLLDQEAKQETKQEAKQETAKK